MADIASPDDLRDRSEHKEPDNDKNRHNGT